LEGAGVVGIQPPATPVFPGKDRGSRALSTTPNQDHKFTAEEKTYFSQFSWGDDVISENNRIFSPEVGGKPAKSKAKEDIKFDAEVFEKVKAMTEEQVAAELEANGLDKSGPIGAQKARLATHYQESKVSGGGTPTN
jgi:hypothetical protein